LADRKIRIIHLGANFIFLDPLHIFQKRIFGAKRKDIFGNDKSIRKIKLKQFEKLNESKK